jgi:hypothetical protein
VSRRDRRLVGAMSLLRREGVHLAAIWLVMGSVLGEFALHARDYIDPDAGRYERLAISIARTHSLVPRINGVNIHYYSLLYSILIAPFFAHGFLWTDLKNAGIASAYIMSSVCIPAFLLTRRVTRARWAPYVAAVLSVCMPWIITSLFLMTEVAAYPAATWALFAMVVAVSRPSLKHDLLAVLALALAFFARGELIGLVVVFPLALVAFELGRASAERVRDRLVVAVRSLVDGHLILLIGYGVVGVTTLVLYVQQRLSSVIGIYGVYSNAGHLAWAQLPRALVEHLATFSLGVGVVPCVIALAWIGANVVRPSGSRDAHAFACVGAFMTAVIFVQATNFDLVVNAYVHDRFLLYVVPVMLIGAVLGVVDPRKPRWSLVLPLVLIVSGFVFGIIPSVTWQRFTWLDLDTPISTVYRVLAFHLGGLTPARGVLVALAAGGTALVAVGGRKLQTGPLALCVFGFCGVAMSVATVWVFVRAFNSADQNSRPVTLSWHGTLDWIDEAVGPSAGVTAIQYPISSDWFVSQASWRDYEYFNKSIVRDARIAGLDPFDYTGLWFPKLDLHFNLKTGAVAESPTPWIVESVKETRFRVAGPAKFSSGTTELIDAGTHWRLSWLTFGLYDDGWTEPGVPMRMRIYPAPGQKTPTLRTVAFVLRPPAGVSGRAITLSAPGTTTRALMTQADITEFVHVCVPAHGYAEVQLAVDGSSSIPGDLATLAETSVPRQGGVFIASLAEANEIGPSCSVHATIRSST